LPVSNAAKREMRAAEKRRVRNKSSRSKCKTTIDKAEKHIFAGELDEAKQEVKTAISTLDKTAKKGAIHSNNAARRKSRLMKKLNQALGKSSDKRESVVEVIEEEVETTEEKEVEATETE